MEYSKQNIYAQSRVSCVCVYGIIFDLEQRAALGLWAVSIQLTFYLHRTLFERTIFLLLVLPNLVNFNIYRAVF